MKITDSRRLAAAIACILTLALPTARAGDGWGVPQLMRRLAHNKSGEATFVEKNYLSVLDKPVVSSGDLSFVAPDRLEKRTLVPRPETMTLDGDSLTVTLPGKSPMTVSLRQHPDVAAFVESIRGTLAGDLTGLQAFYTLKLAGSPGRWQLTLTPKQEQLARLFDRIVIRGRRADIRSIDLEERDGDHSEMVITQSHIRR
ncbi:MAG: outer membrane lipoprotein carrier protein LolA [Betaproteobacteria bacterium]|nr:outer membrane lipoprotein carrier protein LolA [Betaproteobacteria bacterium]